MASATDYRGLLERDAAARRRRLLEPTGVYPLQTAAAGRQTGPSMRAIPEAAPVAPGLLEQMAGAVEASRRPISDAVYGAGDWIDEQVGYYGGPYVQEALHRTATIPQFFGPGADMESMRTGPASIANAWGHGGWGDVSRETAALLLAMAGMSEGSKMLHASELFGPASAVAHAEFHEMRHGKEHEEAPKKKKKKTAEHGATGHY